MEEEYYKQFQSVSSTLQNWNIIIIIFVINFTAREHNINKLLINMVNDGAGIPCSTIKCTTGYNSIFRMLFKDFIKNVLLEFFYIFATVTVLAFNFLPITSYHGNPTILLYHT